MRRMCQISFSLFFFFFSPLSHIHFLLSRGRVHPEAAQDYTTPSQELVFHLPEETDGDYDRLQRGGIVLIEMNIIIFLCAGIFLVCPLAKPDKQEETRIVVRAAVITGV